MATGKPGATPSSPAADPSIPSSADRYALRKRRRNCCACEPLRCPVPPIAITEASLAHFAEHLTNDLFLSFLLAIAAFTGAASQLGNPNQLSVTFRLTPPRLARNTLGMLLESSIAHTPRLTDRSDKPPAIAAHPPTCAMAKRIPSSTTSNPRSAMGALPDVRHRLQGDRNEFWRRSKTPTQENTL